MNRRHLTLLLGLAAAACERATGPAATLVQTTPPAFAAVVTQRTHVSGATPFGWASQYNVSVAIAPSATANALAIVPDSTPVFVSNGYGLARASAASIRVGDAVRVWHDSVVIYDAGGVGVLGYFGTQVVILR